jgi:hypothetical protein
MVPAAARSPLRAVMKRTERREPDGRVFAGSLPAARVVAVAQQFFSTTMTASTQKVVERYILIEAAGVRGQGEEAARASVQQLTGTTTSTSATASAAENLMFFFQFSSDHRNQVYIWFDLGIFGLLR